jgi:hypothetical protein
MKPHRLSVWAKERSLDVRALSVTLGTQPIRDGGTEAAAGGFAQRAPVRSQTGRSEEVLP